MTIAPVWLDRGGYVAGKRALDIVGSLIGLTVSLPVGLLVAAAVRLNSPGPIFFSQPRLGQGGRTITIYKFRKFYHGNQLPSGPAVTVAGDGRMTAVGRILERSKLDELPQLWNVLRGDLSLVGPRPETFNFAPCFDGPYRQVLAYKPGVFGPNQVLFRNEGRLYPKEGDPEVFYRRVLFPRKARVDLTYFPTATIREDLKWMLRGIGAAAFSSWASERQAIWMAAMERQMFRPASIPAAENRN